MFDFDWFYGTKVTVMGLGLHGGGLGAAKWLLAHGATVTVTDMKEEAALAPTVKALRACEKKLNAPAHLSTSASPHLRFVLGRHDDLDFIETDMVIQNPAVPRENRLLALARSRGIPVESDISIFFALCPFPITAITGTKGKTTTTLLLADICSRHDRRTVVGGNVRISPLDALDKLAAMAKRGQSAPPVILELSSWQLEGLEHMKVSPHVALITNLKEDHLNRYVDMDDYARAKELNVMFQTPDDFAVLNAEDARLVGVGGRCRSKVLWFSTKPMTRDDGCFVSAGRAVLRRGDSETVLFRLKDIRMPGAHNVSNALAAACAAHLMGIPPAVIKAGIKGFKGAPGRLEEVAVKRGVRYFNDTTATTPDASSAALKTLAKKGKPRLVLIAGGADKKLRFEEWAQDVKKLVKALVLFDGTATDKMEPALSEAKSRIPIQKAKSMKEAVALAAGAAKKGDIVILSPACASFGLFTHEFDRGDQFTAAVRKLK